MAVVGNDVKTIEQQDTQAHNSIFQQRKGFASNLCKKKKKAIAGSGVVCSYREKKEIHLDAINLLTSDGGCAGDFSWEN